MIRCFPRAFALVLAVAAAPALAAGTTVSFAVENRTGATMTALYSGPSSSDEWGDNVLAGPIRDGETVEITISNVATCEQDFRYEFKGKEPFEEFEINICEINGESYVIQ